MKLVFYLVGTPEDVKDSMTPVWFEHIMRRASPQDRNEFERGWDSGVMACMEYLRRRLNYDERLSLELMEIQTKYCPNQ